jgi:hypothetical protein
MRIHLTTGPYLTAVANAILRDGAVLPGAGDRCPECLNHINAFDQEHAVILSDAGVIVVIGCEGYHVIDPALVGLDRGNWMSVEEMHADDAADGYARGDHMPEGYGTV